MGTCRPPLSAPSLSGHPHLIGPSSLPLHTCFLPPLVSSRLLPADFQRSHPEIWHSHSVLCSGMPSLLLHSLPMPEALQIHKPSMHMHTRTYTQLAMETMALLSSRRLNFLCVEETIIGDGLDRGRDWGQSITSQGGQQRQSTGLPAVFTDVRPGTGTSWPLSASSSGSYSKHRPVIG